MQVSDPKYWYPCKFSDQGVTIHSNVVCVDSFLSLQFFRNTNMPVSILYHYCRVQYAHHLSHCNRFQNERCICRPISACHWDGGWVGGIICNTPSDCVRSVACVRLTGRRALLWQRFSSLSLLQLGLYIDTYDGKQIPLGHALNQITLINIRMFRGLLPR